MIHHQSKALSSLGDAFPIEGQRGSFAIAVEFQRQLFAFFNDWAGENEFPGTLRTDVKGRSIG